MSDVPFVSDEQMTADRNPEQGQEGKNKRKTIPATPRASDFHVIDHRYMSHAITQGLRQTPGRITTAAPTATLKQPRFRTRWISISCLADAIAPGFRTFNAHLTGGKILRKARIRRCRYPLPVSLTTTTIFIILILVGLNTFALFVCVILTRLQSSMAFLTR